MTEHIPKFESKGHYRWVVCSCGWRGKRGSWGNCSGYSYLGAAIAGEWVEHAKQHGLTDDGEQVRMNGELLGTVTGTMRYRKAHGRILHSGTLGSREHTICEMLLS